MVGGGAQKMLPDCYVKECLIYYDVLAKRCPEGRTGRCPIRTYMVVSRHLYDVIDVYDSKKRNKKRVLW